MSEQTINTDIASGLSQKTNFDALMAKKFMDLHYHATKDYTSGPYKGSKCVYVILSSLYDMEGKFIDTSVLTETGPRKLYLFKFFVGKILTFGKSVIPSFTMMSLDQESDSYVCDSNINFLNEVNDLNFIPVSSLFNSAAASEETNTFKLFFTMNFTEKLDIGDIQGSKIKVDDKYYEAKNLVDGFKIFFLFCVICNLFNSIVDIRNAYDYLFKKNIPLKTQELEKNSKIKIFKREDIFTDEKIDNYIGILSEVNQLSTEAVETNPDTEVDVQSQDGSNGSSLMSVSTVSSTSTSGTGVRSQQNQFLSQEDLIKLINKGYEGINKITENTDNIMKDIEKSFGNKKDIYESGVIFDNKNNSIMKNISTIDNNTKKRYAALYNAKSMRGTEVKINPKNLGASISQQTDTETTS